MTTIEEAENAGLSIPSILSPRALEIQVKCGEVNDGRKLVCFLYLLMRDEVTPGRIETILKDVRSAGPEPYYQFCNGYLAQHAQSVADALLGKI